jgi:hypothetical protein
MIVQYIWIISEYMCICEEFKYKMLHYYAIFISLLGKLAHVTMIGIKCQNEILLLKISIHITFLNWKMAYSSNLNLYFAYA